MIIESALTTSLSILFIYTIFQEGMIFEKAGNYLEDKWIYKPLVGCLTCMSPYWGTVFYFAFKFDVPFFQYLGCVCGLNILIGLYVRKFSE